MCMEYIITIFIIIILWSTDNNLIHKLLEYTIIYIIWDKLLTSHTDKVGVQYLCILVNNYCFWYLMQRKKNKKNTKHTILPFSFTIWCRLKPKWDQTSGYGFVVQWFVDDNNTRKWNHSNGMFCSRVEH